MTTHAMLHSRQPNIVSHQGAHMLGYVLEELGLAAAPLHSHLNQRRRLAALHRFKSGAALFTATYRSSRCCLPPSGRQDEAFLLLLSTRH